MNSLNILTINIGNPSLDRARNQVKWLEQRFEDIFVLTETKESEGCKYIANYFDKPNNIDLFSFFKFFYSFFTFSFQKQKPPLLEWLFDHNL